MRRVAVQEALRGGLCAVGVLGALIAQPAFAAAQRDTTAHRDTTAQQPATRPAPPLEALRDDDGLFTLNKDCPVRHGRLNPNIPMMYVNGKPVGFC